MNMAKGVLLIGLFLTLSLVGAWKLRVYLDWQGALQAERQSRRSLGAQNDALYARALDEICRAIESKQLAEEEAVSMVTNLFNTFHKPLNRSLPVIELLGYEVFRSGGAIRFIDGRIRNNTGRTLTFLEVEFSLYTNADRVGSAIDSVDNLAPGETWRFLAEAGKGNCAKLASVRFN